MISAGRYQDISWSKSGYRPANITLLIYTQYINTKNKDTQYGAHSFKKGRHPERRSVAPQAASVVVGNPALCPAFRVRRGRVREYGFAASRARRATRPTPEQVSASALLGGADFNSRRVCWGITRRPSRPALPSLAAASYGRACEPARESGGAADRTDCQGGGARAPTESTADARAGP